LSLNQIVPIAALNP